MKPTRISFDSNAWEAVCEEASATFRSIRQALAAKSIEGFICDASLRIEAIVKRERGAYFAQPHLGLKFEGIVERDGKAQLKWSFGPKDEVHPGLPPIQGARLEVARSLGIKLMRGLAWLGLPGPPETSEPRGFVDEVSEETRAREQRQIEIFTQIDGRGVGKASFDAAGGWNLTSSSSDKRLKKACAEWSDGELVSAHVAYRNDVLCTYDRGGSAGKSILDLDNRAWLSSTYGVVFMTPDELQQAIASKLPT